MGSVFPGGEIEKGSQYDLSQHSSDHIKQQVILIFYLLIKFLAKNSMNSAHITMMWTAESRQESTVNPKCS